MSLVQRIAYAIRTLTEDDPTHYRKNRHRNRNRNRHQQAVALVITFRDLFASGGLNHLLEDPKSSPKRISAKEDNKKKSNEAIDLIAPSGLKVPKLDFTSDLTLPPNLKLAPSEAWYVDLSPEATAVPLLREERIISTSELALVNSSISSTSLVVPDESTTASREVVDATSRQLVAVHRRRQKKKTKKSSSGKEVVVPLEADNENKTVAALRKVLKWSPSKQSAATFALQVPTEEKHKAVAVVENAVNRVKEEQQQQQKKKKLRLFKFTFC